MLHARARAVRSSSRRRRACAGCARRRPAACPVGGPDDFAIARSASTAFRLVSIACCQRPRRMSMCDGMWTLCARPGCRLRKRSAAAIGALGIRRRFDRVNVEMVRERMLRIQLQHRVERRQDFIRARLRLAFRRPLVPRAQVHHRFGEKRAHVGDRSDAPSKLRASRRRRLDRAACGLPAADSRSACPAPRSGRARPVTPCSACCLRQRQFLPGESRPPAAARAEN